MTYVKKKCRLLSNVNIWDVFDDNDCDGTIYKGVFRTLSNRVVNTPLPSRYLPAQINHRNARTSVSIVNCEQVIADWLSYKVITHHLFGFKKIISK